MRIAWHNQHQIADGVWRSNQPGPGRIANLQTRASKPSSIFAGHVMMAAGNQRPKPVAKQASHCLILPPDHAPHPANPCYMTQNLFAEIKTCLMHCKSGADRAGLMSALYLLIAETSQPALPCAVGMEIRPCQSGKNRTFRRFFAAYLPYEKDGMAFYDWVDQVYDPAALTAQFQARGWAVRLTDTILRRE